MTPSGRLPRVDGGEGVVWEPLWRLEVVLRPAEMALLRTAPLRRLHFLDHNGASRIATGISYSRLQHTLGVFALIAWLRPGDGPLRAAALLHDVGHGPFSHTLEGLPGVDHHRWTTQRLRQEPLATILEDYALDRDLIEGLVAGRPESPLRNRSGALHADHLDSWVRGAAARGRLQTPAHELRERLRLRGAFLETDLRTAEELVELVVEEAGFHVSGVNLGPGAVLRGLVGELIRTGELEPEELGQLTDWQLHALLLSSRRTGAGARLLFDEPYRLVVAREGEAAGTAAGDDGPEGWPAADPRDWEPGWRIDKGSLYLGMPRVDGRSVVELSARARELLASATALVGSYRVRWRTDAYMPPSER